jgi:curved DNA-binding protein CbpA
MAKMYHPDRLAHLAPEFLEMAEERMKEINLRIKRLKNTAESKTANRMLYLYFERVARKTQLFPQARASLLLSHTLDFRNQTSNLLTTTGHMMC